MTLGTSSRLVAASSDELTPAIGIAGLATLAFVGFLAAYRPWHLRWGATQDELRRQKPGDDVVSDPTFNATRGVTVNAPSEKVWPWIVQMGFGRAGWYSSDLLDNLGRRSA